MSFLAQRDRQPRLTAASLPNCAQLDLRWDPFQPERSYAAGLEYPEANYAALHRARWRAALDRQFALRSFALGLQVLRSVPCANVARRSPC